jgi:hypothetical protein
MTTTTHSCKHWTDKAGHVRHMVAIGIMTLCDFAISGCEPLHCRLGRVFHRELASRGWVLPCSLRGQWPQLTGTDSTAGL